MNDDDTHTHTHPLMKLLNKSFLRKIVDGPGKSQRHTQATPGDATRCHYRIEQAPSPKWQSSPSP